MSIINNVIGKKEIKRITTYCVYKAKTAFVYWPCVAYLQEAETHQLKSPWHETKTLHIICFKHSPDKQLFSHLELACSLNVKLCPKSACHTQNGPWALKMLSCCYPLEFSDPASPCQAVCCSVTTYISPQDMKPPLSCFSTPGVPLSPLLLDGGPMALSLWMVPHYQGLLQTWQSIAQIKLV